MPFSKVEKSMPAHFHKIHMESKVFWTYWTHGNALLPLTHAQTFFQRCAFLHYHVPATIRVLGSNACTVDENKSHNQDIYLNFICTDQRFLNNYVASLGIS